MIHALTDIHPDAKVGKNVTIDPFTSIAADVEIGDNTWIGSNVTIMDGARIGSNCLVFSGAVIAAVPQDLKFDGEKTTVVIGNNTTIRECVTINRGTKDRYETRVGDHVLLMAYVHVAHDCIIGNNCIVANAVQLGGHVVLGDYAIMGGTSAAHQFVRVGAHAIVAGGSRPRKDIPPFVQAGRNPTNYFGVNSVGLRRRGFSRETIDEVREIYRTIYQRGMNTKTAITYIEENMPQTAERDLILSFVRDSKRGIIKGGDEEVDAKDLL